MPEDSRATLDEAPTSGLLRLWNELRYKDEGGGSAGVVDLGCCTCTGRRRRGEEKVASGLFEAEVVVSLCPLMCRFGSGSIYISGYIDRATVVAVAVVCMYRLCVLCVHRGYSHNVCLYGTFGISLMFMTWGCRRFPW